MTRTSDLLLTALAPAIWGSSYIVATQLLPNVHPIAVALLRALPAGLLLLILIRDLPKGVWLFRMMVLGALNFSIFWSLLFFAAYRLPGGVAAIVGALQPLIVVFAARTLLGTKVRGLSILAAAAGIAGVSILILSPTARLDAWGLIAGFGGAASMALGTVLSRKWQPPVSALTFTAWQLTAGGILLIPIAVIMVPNVPELTPRNLTGLAYLGLIGAAATYAIWLRGIARLQPSAVSFLGLLSPVTAVVLGWIILDQTLNIMQVFGAFIVLCSVWLGQHAMRPATNQK